MASRRKGRILAFQALYAWDLSGNLPTGKLPMGILPTDDLPLGHSEEKAPANEELPEFSRLLIAGTIENISAIDTMIRKHLEHWDFSRLNRVDLAVLRISVYALMYQADTAPSIIINEAIGISKEFGTDDSYRFINGVLDGIRKSLDDR
jgi:N utilization substance protein B